MKGTQGVFGAVSETSTDQMLDKLGAQDAKRELRRERNTKTSKRARRYTIVLVRGEQR